MNTAKTVKDPITGRRVCTLATDYGTTQIVEHGDGCRVGYRPNEGENAGRWLDWGCGEGGFDATVSRFVGCPTFDPSAVRP